MTRPYQMCTRCLMDTTDPDIVFEANGLCNHCTNSIARQKLLLRTDEAGQQELQTIVAQIKAEGAGKPYDCIIGVSGGVDSTYAAYIAKVKLGLRPLAIHLDNGWDSELAVSNIEKVLKLLGIDLDTHVLDWEEFKDLQVAFLRASVPDGEVPSDHAIGAAIYQVAARHGIRYSIGGGNIATESVLPTSWTYSISDWKYIQGVQAQCGTRPLKHYPHYSLTDMIYHTIVRRFTTIRVLNYVPYVKRDVVRFLEEELGWRYYGDKHYESIYTRFYQGYILPRKFNIDKRKAHLSSLIASGQRSREEALHEMQHNPYTDELQREDRIYAIKKLGLTEAEFDRIMTAPVKSYRDYPNYTATYQRLRRVVRLAKRLRLVPQNFTGPF